MDWEKLENECTLEDIYNIICRNKPHHKSKLFKDWDYLEAVIYEELLNEEENLQYTNCLIDEAIEFLKIQKGEVVTNDL